MAKAKLYEHKNMITDFNVIIVGAGAAGLMSAIEAGKRGRKVLLLDHAKDRKSVV